MSNYQSSVSSPILLSVETMWKAWTSRPIWILWYRRGGIRGGLAKRQDPQHLPKDTRIPLQHRQWRTGGEPMLGQGQWGAPSSLGSNWNPVGIQPHPEVGQYLLSLLKTLVEKAWLNTKLKQDPESHDIIQKCPGFNLFIERTRHFSNWMKPINHRDQRREERDGA